jgi:hypothetical protein
MMTIQVDHDMEGDAALLWGTIAGDGWLEKEEPLTLTLSRVVVVLFII